MRHYKVAFLPAVANEILPSAGRGDSSVSSADGPPSLLENGLSGSCLENNGQETFSV